FIAFTNQIIKNEKALVTGPTEEGIRIVSGDTDNHLLLLDITPLNLTGKVAEAVLDEVSITTNKNTIAFDQERQYVTSVVRVGSAAVTTRGFKEDDMKEIASIISQTLKNHDDKNVLEEAAKRVSSLTNKFPLYE